MQDPRINRLPKWAQRLIAQKYNEIERLKIELAASKSKFHPVPPDVMPPENFGGLTRGWHCWVFNNEYRIEPACSSTLAHSIGDTKRTRSQNPKPLYSTRLRALQAAICELEQQHANTKFKIQKEINKEKSNPTPLP